MEAWTKWQNSADNIFKLILSKENLLILIKILLKYISKGPVIDESALDRVMVWGLAGSKPLSESMLTQFAVAFLCHQTSMG